MVDSLSGKKVVIIGASLGIGLAVAKQTAGLGASVVISSRSQDKLDRAKEFIAGQVEAIAADILNEDSVNALFEQVGSFDHLVITAVADENLLRSPLAEMSITIFNTCLDRQYCFADYTSNDSLPKCKVLGEQA